MTEIKWVKSIVGGLETRLRRFDKTIRVVDGHRLSYANEVLTYGKDNKPDKQSSVGYQTDVLIYEELADGTWKPRVVIEAKLRSVTTHDAITYSQKAAAHKNVHPYLRYGILIGDRKHDPLPGRLFRHGQHFDFMFSWKGVRSDQKEIKNLIDILKDEIEASRTLDEIMFNSRLKDRERFTSLHKPLLLKK